MASIGQLFKGLPIFNGGFISIVLSIFLGVVGLSLAGFFVWFILKRRKDWNLGIEFKIPRNISLENGEVKGTLNKEWGKGYYNPKQGVVFIKRKGKKPIPMKPFDIKRYLSGKGILTVIQVGVEDYRPVLDDSYLEVVDDETGETGALIKTRIDTSESKAWRNQWEREAKATYSFSNFLSQHGDKIVMAFVIFIVLVGQAIVITKIG